MLELTNELLLKNLPKASALAHQSIALALRTKSILQLGKGYYFMATISQNMGRPDSAIYYLDVLGKLSREHPQHWKLTANYNQAAGLFYKNTGQPKKALPFMLDNLRLLTKENESRAGLLLNIGNIYTELGDFMISTDYFLQSLRLFESTKNKRGQSFCYQSLGNSFFQLKQYQKAKEYFEKSMALKSELQDKRGLIGTNGSLASVHKELRQYKISEQYLSEALKIAKAIGLTKDEAIAYHQLGLLQKATDQNELARESFGQGLQLARQVGDTALSTKIKSELIGLDISAQKEKQKEKALIENLNTLITVGDRNGETMEYFRLSEYYAQAQQYEKAYEYLLKYHSLNDTIRGNAVLLQLKELEAKYSSEKKEREIALLKKDQELQQSQQRAKITVMGIALGSVVIIGFLLINRYRVMNQIKRQNEMEQIRNSIARDLHDDIGSTLSTINIMSNLAMQEKSNGNNTHLSRIAEQSSRMMENMTDIVWSINPVNDSLEKVAVKMKVFANEILEPKNIAYRFSGEESLSGLALDAEKRKNLFLIFKEAINNAAKYSRATEIGITLKKNEGKLRMIITDNGIGFNDETVKRGNGLKNMESRAANLSANFKVSSASGSGTHIELEMPIT